MSSLFDFFLLVKIITISENVLVFWMWEVLIMAVNLFISSLFNDIEDELQPNCWTAQCSIIIIFYQQNQNSAFFLF